MSKAITERLADVCLTYRQTVLFAVAAVTALAVSALPNARFDNALELWFLEDDPALVDHQELIDTFGSDDLIVVGLEAPDVFAPETLRTIDRITTAAEQAPHVEKVFSLTNIESMMGNGETLDIGELIEFPLDADALPAVRERALANDLYINNIVSRTGDFTCIVVRIEHRNDNFAYKVEAVGALREIMAREGGDTPLFLSGGAVLDEAMFEHSERDSRTMSGAMTALLIVFLAFLLRSAVGVVLPLATVTLATTWALGWMALADVRLNFMTTMLPPLLLAVGVADSMHVLVEYRNRYRAGADKLEVLREVYRELTLPLFLTSLTTSIGMLSLMVSRVQGIREFGLFAALGVQGAFILSITFVPVVLSYLRGPKPWPSRQAARGLSSNSLEALHRFTMKHGTAVAAAFVAMTLVGVGGATQIRAESAFLEMFPDGDPVKRDTRRIEDALAGTITIDVVVDGGEPDGIKNPELLRKMVALQGFMEEQPIVSSSQSVADYFKDLRRAFFSNDQAEYKLPESREEAAQYLLLYEMDAPDGDIKEYVTFDYRRARVSGRVDIESSNALSALVTNLDDYVRENFKPPFSAKVSGVSVLYANMEDYIRASLLRGFSVALLAIFVIMCLLTRSVALGAISMIPNVIPIVLCLGIMGLTGINLDSMTAMVASIAIGLAVDDSIHFVTRVRQNLVAGYSMVRALEEATVGVGRALVYTSLTLSGGFGVMLFAHFVGMVHFGMLCVLTIVFALAADLLLLPVVLRWYDDRQTSVEALEGESEPILQGAVDR